MKYIIILLISTLYSQDLNSDPFSESSGTTGSVGTVTINDEVYNQISLRPEIPIGKLGVGLDLYLYFNDDGLYWESWDFSSGAAAYRTIVDKIFYLRWGQPGDNLYFRAGALPSVTLGHGILVNNYSNIMEYPQVRQIGLNLQANISAMKIEFIHSNFKSIAPGVLGLRGSFPILPKLNVGASFVMDMNQMAGLPDSDGDDYPDYYDFYPDDADQYDDSLYWYNEYVEIMDGVDTNFDDWYLNSDHYNHYDPTDSGKDQIAGFALDISYDLTNKISLYSQFAKLIGKIENTDYVGDDNPGWGLVPIGASAKFGPINVLAEYRMSSRRFIFNYWDQSYDVNRVSVSTDQIITRESQLYKYGELNGFFINANMEVMNLFNMGMGYQNMQGEKWNDLIADYETGESNQTLLTTLMINPSIIPKVAKAEAFYQQSNVPNPFEFEENTSTIWGYNVGVEVSSGVMLLYKARTTYIADLDDPGEFKPVKSVQIETQFIF